MSNGCVCVIPITQSYKSWCMVALSVPQRSFIQSFLPQSRAANAKSRHASVILKEKNTSTMKRPQNLSHQQQYKTPPVHEVLCNCTRHRVQSKATAGDRGFNGQPMPSQKQTTRNNDKSYGSARVAATRATSSPGKLLRSLP